MMPGYIASQFGMDVVFDAISHGWCLANISVVTAVFLLVMVQIFSSENLIVYVVSVLGVTLSNLMKFKEVF